MAITHLILVRSLKFQHIWLQGEILHWFLPKKHKKWPFDKNRSKKQNFQQKKIFTKETFTWKKLFKETNFSTKQSFWQWNKLFIKTTFLLQQTFQQNKHFDETYFLMKQTFLRNKFWNKTNFITYLLLWLLKSEICDWLIFCIIQKFSISFSAARYYCNFSWKC